MDKFAVLIDNISKIVFSRTLKNVDWKNSKLKKEVIKEEVLELRQQAGKNILVGSPGLIVTLTQPDLIDEYQLGVQPTVLGSGLPLFKNVRDRINLKLLKTKTFDCGAVTLYYEPTKNECIVKTQDLQPLRASRQRKKSLINPTFAGTQP